MGLLASDSGSPVGKYPEWTRVVKKDPQDSRVDFYNDQAMEVTIHTIRVDGGAYDKRPKTITANLLLNGRKYRSTEITGPFEQDWSYTFKHLIVTT